MSRRTFVRVIGSLAALLCLATATPAAEPFHGFFQPRGGELYSPLHYWAPAAYKVKYHFVGGECRGCRVSVCPPVHPAPVPVVAPAPAPAKP